MQERNQFPNELIQEDAPGNTQLLNKVEEAESFEILTGIMSRVFQVNFAFISWTDDTSFYLKPKPAWFVQATVKKENSICSIPILKKQTVVYENLDLIDDLSCRVICRV